MIRTQHRILISTAALAACLFLAYELVNTGIYGLTVFVAVPLGAGALASWSLLPQSGWRAVKIGAITGLLGACCFLLIGIEGIICVAMAIPLFVPLAIAGSWLMYWMSRRNKETAAAAMALLTPLALLFDTHAKPEVYKVATSATIDAPPSRIWNNVVAFPDIPDTGDWLPKTGIAFPKRTRIEGWGVGATRYCDLSTGPVVERVTVWDEPRMLRFTVISTPPSMRETGLYGPVHSKHLNGYFISKQGQFTLTPLPGGRTLVEGTSWYQHGLWPAAYWRWWSDAIVHRIHHIVLEHIRRLSEPSALRSVA